MPQYDARSIANWFIERAHQDALPLSIMSILKLAYIAHGWRLEMVDAPLFGNKIEAWQHGPVIPDVYSAFRPQGIVPKTIIPDYPAPSEPKDIDFLEQIYKIYAHLSPFRLSELTHVAGGPWETARNWGGWYAEIPNDLIKSHYISKRQAAATANG